MGKLIFVYAVDGGIMATVQDYVHKLVSPATYPCQLCALTYGPLGERKSWSCAVQSLPLGAEFLHRNEFRKRHPGREDALPAVFFSASGQELEQFISTQELQRCATTEALIALVQERIALRAGLDPDRPDHRGPGVGQGEAVRGDGLA